MKKIACVLLACTLALGLAACGQDENESEFECKDYKYLGESAELGKMFEVGESLTANCPRRNGSPSLGKENI